MTYAKLPGLTWDGTVYENEEMGTLEALLPTGGWPTAHAPAMVELPNGDLLCCWFAGTYEGSADVHIICSVLPHDGTKWLEPVNISGDPTRSEQNPSLFYGPDNAVWAMYTAQLDRVEGKDNMQFTAVVRCQKSTDGGKTCISRPFSDDHKVGGIVEELEIAGYYQRYRKSDDIRQNTTRGHIHLWEQFSFHFSIFYPWLRFISDDIPRENLLYRLSRGRESPPRGALLCGNGRFRPSQSRLPVR